MSAPLSAAEIIDRLREVARSAPAVRVAFLFGSFATGRASARSDIDVAIVPAHDLSLRDELDLAVALERACGRRVDLVRLDRASPLVGREVARDGLLLHEAAPHEAARARARALSMWLDVGPTFERAAERFRRRLAERGVRS